MNILIVGCGKVGSTIAEQLSKENHNITVVDRDEGRLSFVSERFDVLALRGNGASVATLDAANIQEMDLLIAVTRSDEQNILSCLIGKKMGAKNTIARVRDPEYMEILPLIQEDLGLSMSINPERTCAEEMMRVIKFASMIKVDTFIQGRVELLQFNVAEDSPLAGLPVHQLSGINPHILICAVKRKGEDVVIPSGDFVIQAGDRLAVVGNTAEKNRFFNAIGIRTNKVRTILIVGGGKTAYYLGRLMIDLGVNVKIIEKDYNRCIELDEMLPEADVVYGDGTDQQFLVEEGAAKADAFVSLTGVDEENMILSLYAGSLSDAKLITKLNHIPFSSIVESLNLGSLFYPRVAASEHILRYVRAMQNSFDNAEVKTLCRIIDDEAEALEFAVGNGCGIVDIPLSELGVRDNVLIAVIYRGGRVIIPKGYDVMKPGDSVIIITRGVTINTLEEIVG